MFPQCWFSWPTAKANQPTSGSSKKYWARPRVCVLARSRCISQKNQVGFEQMLKLSMNLLIFPMVNTFSWEGVKGVGGEAFDYYTITKWPQFLSCLCLFNFGSPFLSIKHSKLYINSSCLHTRLNNYYKAWNYKKKKHKKIKAYRKSV